MVEKNLASTLAWGTGPKWLRFAAYLRTCRDRLTWLFGTRLTHRPAGAGSAPVAEVVNPGGVILCEHPKEEVLPETAGGFVRHKSYRYGKIMLTARPPEEPRVGEGPPGA